MACSLDISHTYFTLSPRHAVEQQVQGYDASVLRTPGKSRRSYGPTEGIVHQVSLVCLPTCLPVLAHLPALFSANLPTHMASSGLLAYPFTSPSPFCHILRFQPSPRALSDMTERGVCFSHLIAAPDSSGITLRFRRKIWLNSSHCLTRR